MGPLVTSRRHNVDRRTNHAALGTECGGLITAGGATDIYKLRFLSQITC